METWLRNSVIYDGRIFTVRTGRARLDDGTEVHREVVEHGGGVGVTPLFDGHVLLVRQYRIAIGGYLLEIPAGRLEPGDEPETRGRIELEEEVGYQAGRMVHVATCYCSPGFASELDNIYLALDLTATQRRPEYDERIEIVPVPLGEVSGMLARREIVDGKTIIGLRELLLFLDT